MTALLADASLALSSRGVPHALVGAGAMAVHGVSRATFDLDLLVTDASVLDPAFWSGLPGAVAVDARRGDPEDPLAGVVRLSRKGDRDVDVVVGRHAWQAEALARAVRTNLGAVAVPVIGVADLVLLKLYAGGPQDAWDVAQLLAAGDGGAIAAAVERSLPRLPFEASGLWRRIAAA